MKTYRLYLFAWDCFEVFGFIFKLKHGTPTEIFCIVFKFL